MRFGITITNKRILYTLDGGYLSWAPLWLQKALEHSWNVVACHILGHPFPLFRDTPEELPECTYCLKQVTNYDPTQVITLSEID